MKKFLALRGAKRVLMVLSALVVMIPVAAVASHGFTDVPDGHTFHNDIQWMKDNGITTGCGSGNYCPESNVTRGQMAAFMRRLSEKTVVDAATLDGNTAADLTSDVFSTYYDPAVALGAWATVLELKNLPAGNYLFMAKTYIYSENDLNITCRLEAGNGGAFDQVVASVPNSQNQPAAFNLVASIASDGDSAFLKCDNGGGTASVNHTKITAIGVDGLTNTWGG
jgi:hypothetical protein